ncbi:hypothetical protein CROQUDRAFT_104995 [Cronartium quercuum f. sp. fusiforme G11]|uniref:Uncharacterized protein n=1 Tax=Cronartium quercuum f. sp. fusiforme G11 TaxID=708437 RepID=A0A9P6TEK4_9BASI|nr:hypothetical protein CROQUDRAFT_104995 [Cronartium quercuum f. sp. fusiforme G11]
MPSSLITAILGFLTSLSLEPETNPYQAAATYLQDKIQRPNVPLWSQWALRSLLLAFVIMFYQAGSLLYLRIKTTSFNIFSFNSSGMIKIDYLNVGALGYFVYSILIIVNLIFEEVILAGYHDQSLRIFIFGTKFLIRISYSWAFVWVWACHAVRLRWKAPVASTSNPGGTKDSYITWLLHAWFTLMVIWPIAPVFWAFIKATLEFIEIKRTAAPVIASLLRSASSYSPKTYDQSHLLSIVIRLHSAKLHLETLCHCIWVATVCYLVTMLTMTVTYAPLLFISLKGLVRRGVIARRDPELSESLTAQVKSTWQLHLEEESRRHRANVVGHALIAYLEVIAQFPFTIWMLTYKDGPFVLEPTWWIITVLGLHGPYALIGNISLFVLTLRTKKRKAQFNQIGDRELREFPKKKEGVV